MTFSTFLAKRVEALPSLVVFCLVGGLNSAIDFFSFCVLIWLDVLHPLFANVVSFSLGAANSYIVNGLLTFKQPGLRLASRYRVLAFVIVTAICLTVSTAILALCMLVMPAVIAKAISIVLVTFLSFHLNRAFVYRIRSPE